MCLECLFLPHYQLLDLFPDEAGGRSKKDRVIPFLPGKRFPFSSHTSKERAEKRFPEIIKYVRCGGGGVRGEGVVWGEVGVWVKEGCVE